MSPAQCLPRVLFTDCSDSDSTLPGVGSVTHLREGDPWTAGCWRLSRVLVGRCDCVAVGSLLHLCSLLHNDADYPRWAGAFTLPWWRWKEPVTGRQIQPEATQGSRAGGPSAIAVSALLPAWPSESESVCPICNKCSNFNILR